ncbi:MAG: HEAT repeat domain-containing protein [Cyanobacteria bacterium TGS_CYA1]|nr:HEAT repeat domain-containing protein [Cyanobacteria bacterium TGS_CYA1]
MSKAFEEKPQIEADDFEMEHFLFYHGLAGTTPLNQRKFKDVKADINLAFNNSSSVQLASALKIPPLWWEEKLRVIFQEHPPESTVSLIYPELLMHDNWQVRANSSNMLAFIKATDQIDALVESIEDTASNTKAAFVHQIVALAKLAQGQEHQTVEQTIFKYLDSSDPWMRVDATSAACHYGQDNSNSLNPLLESLCKPHLLSDYCAVVASRTIKPLALLENSSNDISVAAGASIISGLLHAARGTFGSDCLKDIELNKCLDVMTGLASRPDFDKKSYFATVSLAILRLSHYLNVDSKTNYSDDKLRAKICEKTKDTANQHEQCNAIILAGELKLKESADNLLSLLQKDFDFVDETIDALGQIEDERAAKPLLALASKLVDLEDRTNKGISAQPLLQDHQSEIKTYWRILQSLENLPSKEVLEFLVKQSADVAPDKRLAALNSMVAVKNALKESPMAPVAERLNALVTDPSLDVRTRAVAGIGTLKIKDEIARLAQFTSAKEVSFQRQVFQTLSELARAGHKVEVEAALRQKLKSVMDPHLSRKLTELIDSLG